MTTLAEFERLHGKFWHVCSISFSESIARARSCATIVVLEDAGERAVRFAFEGVRDISFKPSDGMLALGPIRIARRPGIAFGEEFVVTDDHEQYLAFTCNEFVIEVDEAGQLLNHSMSPANGPVDPSQSK